MSMRSIRTILRTAHVLLGLALGAVVYLPTAWTEPIRLVLGVVVVPLLVLTGLAMWQQGRLRRAVARAHTEPAR